VRVFLTSEQSALELDPVRLREEILLLAERAGYEGDLSVALVTDARIREANREFLGRDEPTDVIAFPLERDEGEIVVSAERAVAVARELGMAPRAELLLYVVHGILHLLGRDDREESEARQMHAETLRLLRSAGYRTRITPRKEGR
jgi:probable rRNA maturation factor